MLLWVSESMFIAIDKQSVCICVCVCVGGGQRGVVLVD